LTPAASASPEIGGLLDFSVVDTGISSVEEAEEEEGIEVGWGEVRVG